eukprot:COSAG03_NODE_2969_length_2319_cov_3.183333_4_plen_83_part_00
MDSEDREEEITPEPRALPSLELSLSLSLSSLSLCLLACLLQHWCRSHIRAVSRKQGHTTPLRWTILQAHWRAAKWLKTYSTG